MKNKKSSVDENLVVKIWTENPLITNKEKTKMYNEIKNSNFVPRTLYTRYNAHRRGLDEGLEENAVDKELERLANAKTRAMIEQKKVVMMKRDVHTLTREVALVDIIIEEVRNTPDYTIVKRTAKAPKKTSMQIVEYLISDEHFTGKSTDRVIEEVFSTITWDLYNVPTPDSVVELRLSFLGDNIEGMAAHKSQAAVAKMVKPTITFGRKVVKEVNAIYKQAETLFHHDAFQTTVVFVPESNHGQIRPLSTQRSEFPEEDMGYVIQAMLEDGLHEDIFMYEAKDGIVETHDTFYLHGHQGFAKGRNFDKIVATLGGDKDVIMGHFHHLESHQKGNRVFLLAPAAKQNKWDYEKQGGFITAPAILRVLRDSTANENQSYIEEWKLMKVGK